MTWRPLALSFEIALAAIALAGAAGIAAGALLARRRFPGRPLVDALLTAPMVLPPTVLGYYLLTLLGSHGPLGRLWLRAVGSPLVFTRGGAIVAAAVGAFPVVAKSARAALEAVDPTLPQAARTLGAGPLRAFLTVKLPLAAGGIAAGMALGFARALGDFGATLMVAGDIPGETQTASLAIFDALQARNDAEAAGMAALLTALAVAALATANWLGERRAR